MFRISIGKGRALGDKDEARFAVKLVDRMYHFQDSKIHSFNNPWSLLAPYPYSNSKIPHKNNTHHTAAPCDGLARSGTNTKQHRHATTGKHPLAPLTRRGVGWG